MFEAHPTPSNQFSSELRSDEGIPGVVPLDAGRQQRDWATPWPCPGHGLVVGRRPGIEARASRGRRPGASPSEHNQSPPAQRDLLSVTYASTVAECRVIWAGCNKVVQHAVLEPGKLRDLVGRDRGLQFRRRAHSTPPPWSVTSIPKIRLSVMWTPLAAPRPTPSRSRAMPSVPSWAATVTPGSSPPTGEDAGVQPARQGRC
jgi:hypothetical protein